MFILPWYVVHFFHICGILTFLSLTILSFISKLMNRQTFLRILLQVGLRSRLPLLHPFSMKSNCTSVQALKFSSTWTMAKRRLLCHSNGGLITVLLILGSPGWLSTTFQFLVSNDKHNLSLLSHWSFQLRQLTSSVCFRKEGWFWVTCETGWLLPPLVLFYVLMSGCRKVFYQRKIC